MVTRIELHSTLDPRRPCSRTPRVFSVPPRAQGLTGLANTIPNAKFQGLRQILHADGMVFDAEYEVNGGGG